MKFVCDSCGTQYLISDEKVRGKGVKVRCKRCGNVILVRPHQAEQASSEPAEDGFGGPTVPNGSPLPEGEEPGRQDEVGMAFDRLLQGELDGGQEEDEEDEGQETQIFSMEELKKVSGVGPGPLSDEDHDKIDEVFSEAASTGIARDGAANGDDGEEWYLAINDEQVGPMNLQEVEARWEAGEVGPDSLAWFPGMSDWQPIEDVPKLRYLLGTLKKTEQQVPGEAAAPVADEQWDTSGSSSLSSLVEEELQAVQATAGKEDAAPEPGPEKLDEELAAPEDLPPWEREDVLSGEVARPSDNYFDPSLDAPTTDSGSPLTDRAGIVKPAYLSEGREASSRTKLIVAGALGAVVLVAGTWVLVSSLSGNNDESHGSAGKQVHQAAAASPNPSTGKPATTSTVQATGKSKREQKAGKAPGGTKKEADGKVAAAGPDQGKSDAGKSSDTIVVKRSSTSTSSQEPKKAAVASSSSRRGTGKKARRGGGDRRRKPGGRSSRGGKTAAGKPREVAFNTTTSSNLPEKLTPAQIKGVMKKYVAAMRKCVKMQKERDPSVKGTMIVAFTIRGSGATSDVKVLSAEHRGTFVDSCITTVIKSIRFPRFSGTPIRIPRVPLRLGE